MKKYPKYKRHPIKAVLPMTAKRASVLLKVLRRGTAVAISKHWVARFIEALEYIFRECPHEHEIEVAAKTFWCSSCGRVRSGISDVEMYPSHEGAE